MTALETLSASPVGRLAIYSLAAALSKRDPFSASTAPALSASSHGVTSAASSESAAEAITAGVADTAPILPGPGVDAFDGLEERSGAVLALDQTSSTSSVGSPLPGSPDGKGLTNEANGLVTRVINEAGQLASKIRTIWIQSGNTSRSPAIPAIMGSAVGERGSSGNAQAEIPVDSLNETQASARSAPGLLSAEQHRNSSKSEETDDEDSDEGHEHNCDGNDRNELAEPANEASLSLGEQEPESEANQIGVEAWDRFLRELPELTAVTLTELVEIPDCHASEERFTTCDSSLSADAFCDGRHLAARFQVETLKAPSASEDAARDGGLPADEHKPPMTGVADHIQIEDYAEHCTADSRRGEEDSRVTSKATQVAAASSSVSQQDATDQRGAIPNGHVSGNLVSLLPATTCEQLRLRNGQHTPVWPNKKLQTDVVKAWVLLEIAGFQEGQEARLLERMSLSDKRVWLSRRIYREHHGCAAPLNSSVRLSLIFCQRDLSV